jgi:hypothetical protein
VVLALGGLGVVASAAPARSLLSGSCSFTGPITPQPPITLIPKPGAHFSYAGTGRCDGAFDGRAAHALPITLTFTNVATAFDTCELGPDFNLTGTLAVGSSDFPITINLARLALFGPFTLTTPGGGRASGTATFAPANPAGAILQCASTGIATATLSGSFTTSAPLVGSVVSSPLGSRTRRRHHRKHRP